MRWYFWLAIATPIIWLAIGWLCELLSPGLAAGIWTKTPKRKEIHVLSLDGGGSRGLMEAKNLDHIMKLATVMKNSPERIGNIINRDKMMKQKETVDKFVEFINEINSEEAMNLQVWEQPLEINQIIEKLRPKMIKCMVGPKMI